MHGMQLGDECRQMFDCLVGIDLQSATPLPDPVDTLNKDGRQILRAAGNYTD